MLTADWGDAGTHEKQKVQFRLGRKTCKSVFPWRDMLSFLGPAPCWADTGPDRASHGQNPSNETQFYPFSCL